MLSGSNCKASKDLLWSNSSKTNLTNLQTTSTRRIPNEVSKRRSTLVPASAPEAEEPAAREKAGHPHPLSNLSLDLYLKKLYILG